MQSPGFSKKKFRSLKKEARAKKIADMAKSLFIRQSRIHNLEQSISMPSPIDLNQSISKPDTLGNNYESQLPFDDFAQLEQLILWHNEEGGLSNTKTQVILQEIHEYAKISSTKLSNLLYDIYHTFMQETNLGTQNLSERIESATINTSLDNRAILDAALPFRFCLWNLRSAHNAGAILRTLDCFGMQSMVLAGYTPGPKHKAFKSAAMNCENWMGINTISDDITELQKQLLPNQKIISLELDEGSQNIYDFSWPKAGAIIVAGNEELGLPQSVLDISDHKIFIPQFGHKASMNVASACAVTASCIRQKYFNTP